MAKRTVKRGAQAAAKTAARRSTRSVAKKRSALVKVVVAPKPAPPVHYATLYLFGSGNELSVGSVSPDRLTVRAGELVDWTIVDATGAKIDPRRVSIRWKDGRTPFANEPVFECRTARQPIARGSKGTYRYSLVLDGRELFDPELEVMN